MTSKNPDRETKSPVRHGRVALACLAFTGSMLGAAYAAVPFYTWFCQVTGFGGTTQRAEASPVEVLDETVTVRFDSNVSPALGWRFRPLEREVEVRIGEVVQVMYEVVGNPDKATVGTATYNVTPGTTGFYFNKLECFCFQEQELAAGERAEMPVVFFVDPAMVEDGQYDPGRAITLSYTFFPARQGERPVAGAVTESGEADQL